MKEHLMLTLLAIYAFMVFVGGFVWERLRKSSTEQRIRPH